MSNNDPQRPFHNTTSQREREEILRAERRASTYAGRAQTEANEIRGRFAAQERATVVGVEQPDLPAPDWAHDPTDVEPPTGYRIDEQVAVGEKFEIERSLGDDPLSLAGGVHETAGVADGGSSSSPLAATGVPATPGPSHCPSSPRQPRGALAPTTEDVCEPPAAQPKPRVRGL
jgi:hypothetical protein